MKKFIVQTGSSRGIGAALKKVFLENEIELVELSRSLGFDLSKPLSLELKEKIKLNLQNYTNIHADFLGFVHCAGVVDSQASTLQEVFQTNFFSFVEIFEVLEKHFESNINQHFVPRVLSLSSGAAINSYVGWEGYCSSKAALLAYSKCLAAKHGQNQWLHLSIAPGTVQTDMMNTVLAQNETEFPSVKKFQELRNEGKLASAESVAANLFRVFQNTELCTSLHGVYSDLRRSPIADFLGAKD
jgi:benzil reductase ((S)-benzoin forming)